MFFWKRMTRQLNRNRVFYLLWIIVMVFLGIASRVWGSYLPEVVSLYVGDILWALMVFLIIGFVLKKQPIYLVGLIALLFACGIEATQLLNFTWLDELRQTTLGALVLGKGFLGSDLVCYTVGILVGVIGEYLTYKLDFMFINKIK